MRVTLTGPDGYTVDGYAKLDNGSTDTMMCEEVADQLNLKGPKESMNVETVIGQSKEPVERKTARLSISARDGTNSTEIRKAFVVSSDKFSMPAQPRPPHPSQSDSFLNLTGWG